MRSTLAIAAVPVLSVLCCEVCADQLDVPSQYGSIQAAINAAHDGDEVVVAAGTYYEALDFLGKAITVRSSDGRDATIIDATDLEVSVAHFHYFEDYDTVLEGFTLTGGVGSNSLSAVRGGGIYAWYSRPTIRDCRIVGNEAAAGGGIGLYGSAARFTDCVIENNSAFGSGSYGGGGVHVDASFPTFINCIVRNNEGVAYAAGGGIAAFGYSEFWLRNCVIEGNSGRRCGGVYVSQSEVDMVNCSMTRNESTNSSSGEALWVTGSSSTARLSNCVLWDNGDAGQVDEVKQSSNGTAIITHSCVEGGFDGEGNMSDNPMFVDASAGDLALSDDSPLINMGDNDAVPAGIETDLAGAPRIVDPTVPAPEGAPIVDMGAFEVQPSEDPSEPACPSDIDGSGDVGVADLLAVINNWGLCAGTCSTGECASDVNSDCVVNVDDLLIVIDTWGECGSSETGQS